MLKAFSAILSLCILLLALLYSPVMAEDDELDFAYGTNHYNGAVYASALIPPSVDEFYLIADVDSVIAAKYTDVYYWALTNEYKANWDAANVIADGTLEILKGGTVYKTLERTEYVIQYDGLNKYETIALYTGEQAEQARQNFEDRQAKYRDDIAAYNDAMVEYRAAYEEAVEKYVAGEISEDELPVQPEESENMTLFSTNLLEGFIVNLPVGSYTFRLRLPDGSIQADSEKKLTVFDAIQEGVTYNILAEDRWTTPEISEDVNETIYTVKDNALYFQPYFSKQYNELYYLRMNDPQDKTARSDCYVWVPFVQITSATLNVETDGGGTLVDEKAYYVKQLLGNTLGYEVVEFDPETMSSSSFEGYELITEGNEDQFQVELRNEQGGVYPGSSRSVHIIHTDRNWIVYAVSLLPIGIGVLLILLRRKKVQYVKIVRE